MGKGKRWLAVLLTLAMLCSLGNPTVFALENQVEPGQQEIMVEPVVSEAPVVEEEPVEEETPEIGEEPEETEIDEGEPEAFESDWGFSGTEYWVNPRYVGIQDETDFRVPVQSGDSVAAIGEYTTKSGFAAALRTEYVNRTEEITLVYKSKSASDIENFSPFGDVLDMAMAHTGVGNQGDYIAWTHGGCSVGYRSYYDSGYYCIAVTYYFNYYTTASQEAQVTNAVKNVLSSLNISGKSNYEKVKAIYQWICDNVSYDYYHLNLDPSYPLMYTAYGAIIDGASVCQGYSVLFYRMVLDAGVDCRMITSDAMNHAWNICKMGSYYYYVDTTWDAGAPESDWWYFLKNKLSGHDYGDEYSDAAFAAAYPLGPTDYDPSNDIPPDAPAISSVTNAADGLTLRWGAVSNASGYDIYRYSSSTGTYKYIKSVTGTSYTDPGATDGVTNYYKLKSYRKISDGNYIYSNFSTTGSVRRLKAPVVSSVVNTTGGLNVSWSAVTGATGYDLYRYDSASGSYKYIKSVTGTSYTDSTPNKGVTNYYKLKAYYKKSAGGYDYSAISTKSGYARQLSAPVVSSVTNVETGLKVNWGAVAGATGYDLYRYDSASGCYKYIKSITGTTYTDTGAAAGTTNYYKLRAYYKKSDGNYDYSAISTSAGYTRRLTKPKFTGASSTGTGIRLTWGAVTGARGYDVYRYDSTTKTYQWVKSVTETSYTDTAVPVGVTQYYRLKAYYKLANGKYAYSVISDGKSGKR